MPYADPIIRAKYHREYNQRHKERIKEYKLSTKDRINELHRQWCKKNQEKRRRWCQRYRDNHPKHHTTYQRNREATDVSFRMERRIRSRIYNAVRRGYGSKSVKTTSLLGCSIESFKIYLESRFTPEMSWGNYGKVWEIDHIMPCAIFDLSKREHQKRCFHFSNLQPLLVSDNRSKRDSVITDQFNLL